MAAEARKLERNAWRGPARSGDERVLRKERVVARIDDQRRHADVREPRRARGALPIVVDVAKTVQRRGIQVVEFTEGGGAAHFRLVEQRGKALQLREGFRLQGREKHARV